MVGTAPGVGWSLLYLAALLAPGFVIVRLVGWQRRLPWYELTWAALIVDLGLAGWLGLVLAQLGRFGFGSALLLQGAVLGVALAAWGWRRRRPAGGGRDEREGLSRLVGAGLVVVLILAAYAYRVPAEAVFGTHDAGVRLGSALQLARTGSFYVHAPTAPEALATGVLTRPLILGLDKSPGITALLPAPAAELGVPAFNGLYEVLLAEGYLATGNTRWADFVPASLARLSLPTAPLFLYVTPLCALLALLGLFLIARLLVGPWVALLATALLAACLPQVYYATLTMAEVPTQLFLLAAAWGTTRFALRRDRAAAFFGGAMLGLAVLVRLDAVLLYAMAGVWLLGTLLLGRWGRAQAYFYVPAFALLLHGALQYLHFAAPYFWLNIGALWERQAPRALALAALGLVALALLVITRRRWLGWLAGATRRGWPARGGRVLAPAVLVWGAAEYFLRPLLAEPAAIYSSRMGEIMIFAPERSLVMLGWYLTPPVLAVAFVGLASWCWRPVWYGAALAATGTFLLLFLLHETYVTPHHVFWVRRFLPVVIPFLLLCAASGVAWLARPFPGRLAPLLGGTLGLAAVLSVASVPAGMPLAPADFSGATTQLERLGELVPRGAIVILEPGASASWLDAPLQLILGATVYELHEDRADVAAALLPTLAEWQRAGQKVYVLAEMERSTLTWRQVSTRLAGATDFSFPYLDHSYEGLPQRKLNGWFTVEVYELVGTTPAQPSFPYTVDVGDGDYGFLDGGWLARQRTAEATYRFTGPSAALTVPVPAGGDVRLSLSLRGGRPSAAPPARVRMLVDGEDVGLIAVPANEGSGFPVYALNVPGGEWNADAHAVIELEVAAWTPAEYGQGDIRALGVGVDWVKVESVVP